jgi:hypothetical protein
MPTLNQLNTPAVLKIGERAALEQWATQQEIAKIERYLLNDADVVKKAKRHGLTIDEQIAIYYYTGYGADSLNMMLNDETKFNTSLARAALLLNQALDKLPNHQGTLIRREKNRKYILENYITGAIVTHYGFTSTTYGSVDVFPDRPIRMVIYSETGKNIHWISQSKDYEGNEEFEVLLSQPKRFLIVDRYEVDDYIEVVMQEVK